MKIMNNSSPDSLSTGREVNLPVMKRGR